MESYDFSKIPFDEITKLGQRSMLYRDIFNVSWLLGRYCNYKCSYCWTHGRGDVKDHRPTSLILSTMDEIKRQARERNYNSFHFSFSGGEPTLHPGYLDILRHYADDTENCNYQSAHMTTNLSRGMNWFERYVEATKSLHRVSVTASLHSEYINTTDQKKGFADKLIYLQENDVHSTINMVMVPERFEWDWDIAEYFHNRGINVTLKPQSDTNAARVVDGYTDSMLERLHNGMPQRDYTSKRLVENGKVSQRPKLPAIFHEMAAERGMDNEVPGSFQVEMETKDGRRFYMDQAERFNAFEFNKFTGWDCESGYRSIIIREPDGTIKRSYSCHDAPIGHIETGFKLFDKPTICTSPSCVSSADSKIPKYKNTNTIPTVNL